MVFKEKSSVKIILSAILTEFSFRNIMKPSLKPNLRKKTFSAFLLREPHGKENLAFW